MFKVHTRNIWPVRYPLVVELDISLIVITFVDFPMSSGLMHPQQILSQRA